MKKLLSLILVFVTGATLTTLFLTRKKKKEIRVIDF